MNVQTNIDAFNEIISPYLAAYRYAEVAFVAVKGASKLRLLSGRIILNVSRHGLPVVPFEFESEHLVATHFSAPVRLENSRSIIEGLSRGTMAVGQIDCQLEMDKGEGLTSSMELFNHSLAAGVPRVPRITIRGIGKNQLMSGANDVACLDWELKAASPPFESLNELLAHCGLAGLYQMGDMTMLELAAAAPAQVGNVSVLSGGVASITLLAGEDIDTRMIKIGYRMPRAGRMERGMLDSSSIEWAVVEDAQRGMLKFPGADAALLQVFLSYKGVGLHQWWITDPDRSVNPRLAAHRAVDPDLKGLRDLLLTPENREKFETAIAMLMFVSGFLSASYGLLPRLKEFADLMVATPTNRIAVVECTTGLPGIKDKLAKLKQRSVRVREQLDLAGFQNIEVLPVLVTACKRDEISVHMTTAAEHRIALVSRETLESLIERVNFAPNPEALFDEAKALVPAA